MGTEYLMWGLLTICVSALTAVVTLRFRKKTNDKNIPAPVPAIQMIGLIVENKSDKDMSDVELFNAAKTVFERRFDPSLSITSIVPGITYEEMLRHIFVQNLDVVEVRVESQNELQVHSNEPGFSNLYRFISKDVFGIVVSDPRFPLMPVGQQHQNIGYIDIDWPLNLCSTLQINKLLAKTSVKILLYCEVGLQAPGSIFSETQLMSNDEGNIQKA